MKKLTLLPLLIPFFCLAMNQPAPFCADRTPGTVVQGATDPYEVTLYRKMNYVEPIGTWKLAQGMRMLKVPKIDQIPASIFLGSRVAVIFFPYYDFYSHLTIYTQESQPFGSVGEPLKWYLYCYQRERFSSPKISFPDRHLMDPFTRCSLIIHRIDIDDYLGVYLESGTNTTKGNWGQFYPLPDNASESAIIYNKIPAGGPFKLHYMPGGRGVEKITPTNSPPTPYNMPVTIGPLNLPYPNPKTQLITGPYELDQKGITQIPSIMIQYKGPFTQSAYISSSSARVVAPTAPTTVKVGTPTSQVPIARTGKQVTSTAKVAPITMFNVSGQWKSNIGLTYTITQQQNNFQWTVANSAEKGNGTLSGYDISASWQGPQGGGSTQGKITTVDASGKAIKIIWNNGVQFLR